MTNDEARMNDEIRMTKRSIRTLFGHFGIRTSFVIRHSCFVIVSRSPVADSTR